MGSERRTGKHLREKILAAALLAVTSPLFVVIATAIKLEGLFRRNARGPVLFGETRIGRGRTFTLLKFRTLTRSALEGLGPGPTHIKALERAGELTLVGQVLKQWYLDELPQLINIVRGDMGLIGTRPWPIELYEEEMAKGITRKRDMPAGLVGPVQASKGSDEESLQLDLDYWEAYRTYPGWKLLLLDLSIIKQSLKTQLRHEGL